MRAMDVAEVREIDGVLEDLLCVTVDLPATRNRRGPVVVGEATLTVGEAPEDEDVVTPSIVPAARDGTTSPQGICSGAAPRGAWSRPSPFRG